MKRKVVKVGPMTLMVSLPAKWVQEQHIESGQELYVTLSTDSLLFTKSEVKPEKKKIEIDISLFNKYVLFRYWEMVYIKGYDEIVLIHRNTMIGDVKGNQENVRSVVKRLCTRSLGLEIISQTMTRTEIRSFLTDESEKLEQIEKRIFFLLKEFMADFERYVSGKLPLSASDVLISHDIIVKYIKYFLRMVEKSDKTILQKQQLYVLYTHLNLLVNKFRFMYEIMEQGKLSAQGLASLRELFDILALFFEAYFKNVIDVDLLDMRYKMISTILTSNKYSIQDMRVFFEARIFLDIAYDFSRVVVANRLSEKKEG